MREPISRDSASPRELAEATKRLDRALDQLEAAFAAKVSASGGAASPNASDGAAYAALQSDNARLAADLDVARARESQLESAHRRPRRRWGGPPPRSRRLDEGQGVDDDGDANRPSKPEGDKYSEEAA